MKNYGGYEDSPVLAELYDLVPAYIQRADIDFYRRQCSAISGRILELGCGTGRILLNVAEGGSTITGLDVSGNMLERCRLKLENLPGETRQRVRLVHASMIDFDLDGTFDLAIIPFRAFQHIVNTEDQLSCLNRIAEHLSPGGKLIFDVFHVDPQRINNPDHLIESEDCPEMELPDGRRMRRCNRIVAFNPAEQYNDVELIYYLTDIHGTTDRIIQSFAMRYFSRYETEHLLARCGFEVENLYGDFDESPLQAESPEMIFLARKLS